MQTRVMNSLIVLLSAAIVVVFILTDHGEQGAWQTINNGLQNLHVRSISFDLFDDKTVYAGTDSGLYKSIDMGDTWLKWGLDAMSIGDMIQFPYRAGFFMIGTADGGVWLGGSEPNKWFPMRQGLPTLHALRLAGYKKDGDFQIFVSPDRFGVYQWNWDNSSWVPVGAGGHARCIKFSSSGQVGIAGMSTGFWKSTNGGTGWSRLITKNSFPNSSIFAVAVNPLNALLMYASPDSGGIYGSEDGGVSWHSSSKGIPSGVTVTTITRDATGNLYAGTDDAGVFISSDGANSWIAINEGLTNLRVSPGVITLDAEGEFLYVGTDGGGIFRRKLR